MDYDLLVNEAFKQYQSVLALSRSPLAASDLAWEWLRRNEVESPRGKKASLFGKPLNQQYG